MPARNASARRLRDALDDYTRSIAGDTGTRRGSVRSSVNAEDTEMVTMAQALMAKIDGGSSPDAPRDTPGSRARDRAATTQNAPGGWAESSTAAKALMGAAPGAPIPSSTEGGATA